jgi:hypothetical protein
MRLSAFSTIKQSKAIRLFLVFLLFFTAFILIQFSSLNLTGTDAYYHIKYANLYQSLGIVETLNNFSIGEYTILNKFPTDLSFFHHIFLIPFTYGDLIAGSKIAAVFLAALIFSLFYWILKKSKIKYSLIWTLLLFAASSDFIFRVTLSRAFLLSIIFLILGFYLIINKKYFYLLLLSLIYTLTYTASQLILIIGLIYVLIEYWKTKKFDWRILAYLFAGLLIGLIVRPDFPQNFYTIFIQNFYVIFYKLKGVQLNIGVEMHPISASVKDNLVLIYLFGIGIASMIINFIEKRIKKNKLSIIYIYAFSLSVFFCILTFMSQRFFEYWIPFTVLFAAFTFKYLSRDNYWKRIIAEFIKIFQKKYYFLSWLKYFFLVALGSIIIFFSYANITKAIKSMEENIYPFDKYKGAGEWLKQNTLQNSIVFNANWDNFPQLFFYNHHNRYIVGMDPTFMYVYDKKLYWLWHNITNQGIICSQNIKKCPNSVYTEKISQRGKKIHQIIKDDFQSRYIFIDNRNKTHKILKGILVNSPLFKKVYQSPKYPEVIIFQTEEN